MYVYTYTVDVWIL